MRIAILGATSEIAKDLILLFSTSKASFELVLFGRHPLAIREWLECENLQNRYFWADLNDFGSHQFFDAILNFIGSGSPSKTADMGSDIYCITEQYDLKVMGYLKSFPDCKYIFMSSGAVYGASFEEPISDYSAATMQLNKPIADYYGAAKLVSEIRHRSYTKLAIVDLRIFSYFSHTQNINSNYLMCDIYRAIKESSTFATSESNIFRDYIDPLDLYQLIVEILRGPSINAAFDCYSKSPIGKLEILKVMQDLFGLRYKLISREAMPYPKDKIYYYSTNKNASILGYAPSADSLSTVINQIQILLSLNNIKY